MSASASQPALDVKLPQKSPRTRLQPIGGSGKSAYAMFICLVLSVCGALASRSYSKGGTAHISSNAPGANVRIDGNFSSTNTSGAADFQGLAYGARNLQIAHRDYEPVSTTIGMGWLSDNRFSFQLKPIPLTLTINSAPGAEVLLNGKSLGTVNNQGVFETAGVMPGDYDIDVTLPGYNRFHMRRHLSPRFERLFAGLNISSEKLRQIEEQQQQAQANAVKAQQLLATARQQFNARQYKAALTSVEEVLNLEPGNVAAEQLKTQVVQTINILK